MILTRGLLTVAIGISIVGHAHWGCAACRPCDVLAFSFSAASPPELAGDCHGHHHRQPQHDDRNQPDYPCSPSGHCVYFVSRAAGSDLCFRISHVNPLMQTANCDATTGPSSTTQSTVDFDCGPLRLAAQRSRCRVLLL